MRLLALYEQALYYLVNYVLLLFEFYTANLGELSEEINETGI